MDKIVDFLERYLSGPMGKLAAQKHLRAIRDGVASTIPFIIVGSLFLILAAPPFPEGNAIRDWLLQFSGQFIMPFRVSMFIMTLYATFGVSSNLAQSYKLDGLTGGQLGVLALLMTTLPFVAEGHGWVLPMANLGGAGMFVGILVAIFAVEVYRVCKEKNITIRMPEQVPDSLSRSFAAITPAAIIVIVLGIITVVFEIDLHTMMHQLVSPLVIAGDSLPGALALVFLITFFWSFGIHGVSVIGSIARPFWMVYADANAAAHAAGEVIPHVAPETFYQWFVWIGGAGATLGLVIAGLIAARSSYLKAMSKACIIPGLFNINEPVIFGMPIVLNPILMIPFMAIPLLLTVISWFATTLGFVDPTVVIVPWTLPAPIGALLATGGDWRAVVLVVFNTALATILYLPFLKNYDRTLLAQELETKN